MRGRTPKTQNLAATRARYTAPTEEPPDALTNLIITNVPSSTLQQASHPPNDSSTDKAASGRVRRNPSYYGNFE